MVAAVLGASVTRDFAGDCGGAGCAWQLEGKVRCRAASQHLRKDGWMNTFDANIKPFTRTPRLRPGS